MLPTAPEMLQPWGEEATSWQPLLTMVQDAGERVRGPLGALRGWLSGPKFVAEGV